MTPLSHIFETHARLSHIEFKHTFLHLISSKSTIRHNEYLYFHSSSRIDAWDYVSQGYFRDTYEAPDVSPDTWRLEQSKEDLLNCPLIPDIDKEIIESWISGKKQREIAPKFGMGQSALSQRVRKAFARLKLHSLGVLLKYPLEMPQARAFPKLSCSPDLNSICKELWASSSQGKERQGSVSSLLKRLDMGSFTPSVDFEQRVFAGFLRARISILTHSATSPHLRKNNSKNPLTSF